MPKNEKDPKTGLENEGEGSRTAARHYDEATEKFIADGKVAAAAKKAVEALKGPEAEELKRAESEGMSRAAVPSVPDQDEKKAPSKKGKHAA